MSNHLINEQSPYLRQHADNPVDWFPWNNAAFEKARGENKPIFLSIGYATCHWCHVMAHESFEDTEVAETLNRSFVAIKVDREERPDIDHLYMTACQALTGQGGWPLSLFLTPEGKPFYAGTYFPKKGRFGMPGFLDILKKIARLWEASPEKLLDAGNAVTRIIKQAGTDVPGGPIPPVEETLTHAYAALQNTFDAKHGGFGAAPKFPTPHHLTFLLRWYSEKHASPALKMVEKTLQAMRSGGIFDQIGYGFHRYSVDTSWHVPHFEKMLYDQALLMMAFAECYQVTGNPVYAGIIDETLTYLLRDMRHPDGGFFSAEDADSDGKEGRFYLWRPEEITSVLGRETGALICRFFDITKEGNFEAGMSIPRIPVPDAVFAEEAGIPLKELRVLLQKAIKNLFEHRNTRNHPLKDDKILTSWNGLIIAALATASRATGHQAPLNAAKRCADFILASLKKGPRLYHRYRNGNVAVDGFLEDYAFFAWGLLELYESSLDASWLETCLQLTDTMIERFEDQPGGGFFFTGKDETSLFHRTREIYDGAIPSSNAVALSNLIRLGHLTGQSSYHEKAAALIQRFSSQVSSTPQGYTHFLGGLMASVAPYHEIIVTGNPAEKSVSRIITWLQRQFLPNTVILNYKPGDEILPELCPFLKSYPVKGRQPVVYICENRSCQKPVSTLEEVRQSLMAARDR